MNSDWADISYSVGSVRFKCLAKRSLPFINSIVIDKRDNQKIWHLHCDHLCIKNVLLLNAKNEDDAKLMAVDYVKCMLYKVIEALENDS